MRAFDNPIGAVSEEMTLESDCKQRIEMTWHPAIGHLADHDKHSLAMKRPLLDDRLIPADHHALNLGHAGR